MKIPHIAMRTNSDPVQFLLSDHLGSTSLVVSTSGTIVAQNRYMPWGEVRYSSGTMTTDYIYTGQKNAPEIGLMFYNARWYDPAIAHFTQADTIIPGAGSPQAWDRYAYVFNNPLFFIDPSGHHKITVNSSWECGPDGALCSNGSINHQHSPDKVDDGLLTTYVKNKIEFSGEMMYKLYQNFWKEYYGTENQWKYDFDGNGRLSIFDFLLTILSFEFFTIDNEEISAQFVNDLTEAGRNSYGCSHNGVTNACTDKPFQGSTNASFLNWLGGLESARRRFEKGWGEDWTSEGNNILATTVGLALLQPYESDWKFHTYDISKWGNLSLFSKNVGPLLNSEIRNYGLSVKKDFGVVNYFGRVGTNQFFIMTQNQYTYWSGVK